MFKVYIGARNKPVIQYDQFLSSHIVLLSKYTKHYVTNTQQNKTAKMKWFHFIHMTQTYFC